MKKEIRYNYVYLFYDIEEPRVQKVFKICKKYLNHYQNSIFCGEITPTNIKKLEEELNSIVLGKDKITILKFIRKEDVCKTVLNKESETSIFL